MRWKLVLTCAAVSALSSSVSAGDLEFYSVDMENDKLVTIDAVTGVVTEVGPLGIEVERGISGIRMVGGRLYAVGSSNTPNASLHEIDPATGTVLRTEQLTVDGAGFRLVESMTLVDGRMVIGFEFDQGADLMSELLGDVSLDDGTVTNVRAFGGSFIADFDGMASCGAIVYAWDVNAGGSGEIRLYAVDAADPNSSVMATFPIPEVDVRASDVVGTSIYGLHDDLLQEVSLIDGSLLRSVTVRGDSAFYGGLTVVAPPPCEADLGADGAVDFSDLLSLLAAWGPCR